MPFKASISRLVPEPSPSADVDSSASGSTCVQPPSLGAPVLGGVVAEQVNPQVVAPSATTVTRLANLAVVLIYLVSVVYLTGGQWP